MLKEGTNMIFVVYRRGLPGQSWSNEHRREYSGRPRQRVRDGRRVNRARHEQHRGVSGGDWGREGSPKPRSHGDWVTDG